MAGFLSACGTTHLDAGSNDDGDAGAVQGHVSSVTPSNSYGYPCDLPAPSWLGGTWGGRFDSFVLPSGSSSVRISIKGAYYSEGGLCGTITFGEGEPLPLPTDPSLPPPGVPSSAVWRVFTDELREGFPFEFASPGPTRLVGDAGFTPNPPTIEGQRLRTNFNMFQPYKAWCTMQVSYPAPAVALSPYTCVPPDAFSTDGKGVVCDILGMAAITVRPGTCAPFGFCSAGLCECYGPKYRITRLGLGYTEDGCTASSWGTRLDATVVDDTMSGSIVLTDGVEGMHLTRLSLRADCAECFP
jgi:hypothetical protein